MRDFLKAQLALLIMFAIVMPGCAVALMLAFAIHGEGASLLVSFLFLALVGWFALALLRRLGLWEGRIWSWDGDIDFDEPDDKGFDWPGQIAAAIILFVSAMGFAYWEDYAETVFHSLKPHIGELWAVMLVGPGAFCAWLFFIVDSMLIFGFLTGRAKPRPRHPDLRNWR